MLAHTLDGKILGKVDRHKTSEMKGKGDEQVVNFFGTLMLFT